MVFVHNNSLWPKGIRFDRLQRGYLLSETATFCGGQRSQNLRIHNEDIRVQRTINMANLSTYGEEAPGVAAAGGGLGGWVYYI